MPKLFGFSRRKTKLGRLKSHLGDPLQGTKSPLRPTKRTSQSNGIVKEENIVSALASGRSEEFNNPCSSDASDLNNCSDGNSENWMVLSTSGVRPSPRFHHAAAVIGNKMVVVGGDSGHGMLDNTMILDLDKLTWAAATPKVHLSQTGLPLKIPSCKGHCLVPWGKVVLLVGGKTDPVNNKVSVWSFNTETECWSNIDAKGDVPAARSGHIVIRAGPVLILFGGEDAKGRKLKDLHMFDLKSLTWLPLNYTGTGPSARSNHVAALVDDRILLVFGGHSRTMMLNDLYSLDFETMVWTKVKTKGRHPSPRAGCCGFLCGTKWYIVGGGSKKRRHAETWVFDVSTYEWSVSVSSHNASITTNKGFSLIPMYHKDKMFLVAFGGTRKEPSNQIEILVMVNEHSKSRRYAQDADPSAYEDYSAITKEHGTHLNGSSRFVDSVARNSLASALEHHVPGRKSVSDSSTTDPNLVCGSVSLCKQFHNEEDCNVILKAQKSIEDGRYKESDNNFQTSSNASLQGGEQRISKQETTIHMDIAGVLANSDENIVTVDSEVSTLPQKRGHNNLNSSEEQNAPLETDGRPPILTNPSNIYQLYDTKVATLTRKNSILEGQLAGALANQEATEKNLSSVIKGKQDAEKKFTDSIKEVELLKEKLASMELAQEEANSLSNIVHSDNVRLEHDVAFLKAILDDTQKELHSTRGVLAGERARAFQLQVEVFHLRQRLQTFESRAPTPRKPYRV